MSLQLYLKSQLLITYPVSPLQQWPSSQKMTFVIPPIPPTELQAAPQADQKHCLRSCWTARHPACRGPEDRYNGTSSSSSAWASAACCHGTSLSRPRVLDIQTQQLLSPATGEEPKDSDILVRRASPMGLEVSGQQASWKGQRLSSLGCTLPGRLVTCAEYGCKLGGCVEWYVDEFISALRHALCYV